MTKFRNIVEKQQVWDSWVQKYGEGVKGRQIYADLLDKRISGAKDDYSGINQNPTTLRELIQSVDIDDKELLTASMLDEGADKWIRNMDWTGDNDYMTISGFDTFGLDTVGERMDEFIKKGYLPKDVKERVVVSDSSPRYNEKGEARKASFFQNLNDVVLMKKAFYQSARDNATNAFKQAGIKPDKEILDYFTIAGFNMGEGGARSMIREYKEKGLLESKAFLQDSSVVPSKFKAPHNNAVRRMQAAEMLRNENPIMGKQPIPQRWRGAKLGNRPPAANIETESSTYQKFMAGLMESPIEETIADYAMKQKFKKWTK